MRPYLKSQILELVVAGVSGGNTQVVMYFTDQPFLRDKLLNSIECYNATDIPKSPLGNALVSSAQMSEAYLTLYGDDPESIDGAGQWVQQVPLVSLHRVNNGSTPYVFQLDDFYPRKITWEKSFITLTTALANTTNLSFIFNIGYQNQIN